MRESGSLRLATVLALTVVAVALAAASPCHAQGQPAGEQPASQATPAATESDPCGPVQPFNTSWFDWLHRKVFRTTCGSATWFDGFFGDERLEGERRGASGKVSLFAQWSEAEKWNLDGRFRVKLHLPHMDERIEALAARWQEDEYVADTAQTTDPLPLGYRELGDADWLLGLGYSPIRGRRQVLRFAAGVNAGTPLDPFGKVELRHYWILPSDWMARWRQTGFWSHEKGFGTTSRFDLDRRFGSHLLLRNSARATYSESTDGLDWYAEAVLFQDILHGRAMAYQTWIRGATGAPVSVTDYGVRVRYRQRFLRDWLFAEASTGLTWVRPEPSASRERSWGAGIGLEMLYGYTD